MSRLTMARTPLWAVVLTPRTRTAEAVKIIGWTPDGADWLPVGVRLRGGDGRARTLRDEVVMVGSEEEAVLGSEGVRLLMARGRWTA